MTQVLKEEHMKKTMLTVSVLLCAAGAFANSDLDFAGALAAAKQAPAPAASVPALPVRAQGGESIVADKTTEVDVDLNAATVKCSAADYSMPMLKVLVPGLAELTVLNHRNTREGAPCIAAGRCTETVGPQTILKGGEGSERVPVRVVLKKIAAVDGDACHVTLVETVTTSIRGVPFFHERSQDVADRAAADCR
jgi:hypothetical protein